MSSAHTVLVMGNAPCVLVFIVFIRAQPQPLGVPRGDCLQQEPLAWFQQGLLDQVLACHFTDEKIKAQRDQVISLMSHSRLEADFSLPTPEL